MNPAKTKHVDYLIVGGGFYGCCLALFLRSLSKNVIIIEERDRILDRASRVNQARIHTGFHYPRSAVTAVKSMALHRRFMEDFSDAVFDDFQMLYAIAKRGSKVSAKRFHRMFRDIAAPIEIARQRDAALFEESMIETAFTCQESAFDCRILSKHLSSRLDAYGVEVRSSTSLQAINQINDVVHADLSDGTSVTARYTFNVTYSGINRLLKAANLPLASLKHELTELALVRPPEELSGIGVTVMDGPFFSCMPYPSESLYTLSHVRYTPHESWVDSDPSSKPGTSETLKPLDTRYAHMIRDAGRYMPAIGSVKYERSLYEVKTVLLKNEADDGRPILFQRNPVDSRVISVLGGKIDNIYDLFDFVKKLSPEFRQAGDQYLTGLKK